MSSCAQGSVALAMIVFASFGFHSVDAQPPGVPNYGANLRYDSLGGNYYPAFPPVPNASNVSERYRRTAAWEGGNANSRFPATGGMFSQSEPRNDRPDFQRNVYSPSVPYAPAQNAAPQREPAANYGEFYWMMRALEASQR